MEWTKDKPAFTEECILLTATKINDAWDYSSWLIIVVDGIGENDQPGWYYGLCDMSGEEWGDWADFKADLYLKMPLLK